MSSTQIMSSKECVEIIIKALDDKKGQDIKVFDVDGISGLADYFIIATGSSTPHIKTLADTVKENVDKTDFQLYHVEGEKGADWILLDFGDIVVNIMSRELREFYGLERLWQKN